MDHRILHTLDPCNYSRLEAENRRLRDAIELANAELAKLKLRNQQQANSIEVLKVLAGMEYASLENTEITPWEYQPVTA